MRTYARYLIPAIIVATGVALAPHPAVAQVTGHACEVNGVSTSNGLVCAPSKARRGRLAWTPIAQTGQAATQVAPTTIPTKAAMAYLADLKPVGASCYDNSAPADDSAVNGVPFKLRPISFPTGVGGCGGGYWVEFNLARSSQRLSFKYGISDRSGSGSNVHLKIQLDGATLEERDVILGGEGIIDLSVASGLRLRIDASGHGLLLVDGARLTK